MTRRRRQGFVGAALALVAAAALAALATFSGGAPATAPSVDGVAAPLAKRMADLRTAPGSTQYGTPSSWEDEDAAARAYPAADIEYSWLTGARAGWEGLKTRPLARGKGRPGAWVSVGPDSALYPLEPLRDRTLYVPSEYIAGSRMPDVAIAPGCRPGKCTLYVGSAGGGVWKTTNALADTPKWTHLSAGFKHQAIGSVTLDPSDPSGNTLYVGTGEANAAASAAAGVGIYKSTDGGANWTHHGEAEFGGRAVGSIAVDPTNPNVVYAASTRGARGIGATTPGAVTAIPGAAQWGLYKSTDGGATWTFVHNGSANAAACSVAGDSADASGCSVRGVRRVQIDPHNSNVLYAGSYSKGLWRSPDAGATWTQIFEPIAPGAGSSFTERPEFDVAKMPNNTTRIYMQIGSALTTGLNQSRFFVIEDAAGAATATEKSSTSVANPGWGVFGLCSGQCWYDQIVHSPDGHPDMVYVGGIFKYGEQIANHRGVVMSEDGGNTWYDMTEDVTDDLHPTQLHPDQHALVTHPDNPYLFFEASDGGLVRSSGQLVDRSAVCATRGLSGASLARCEQMLSKVPSVLTGLNKGLKTLQFFTLSASPFNPNLLQGGTQDNGTWTTDGNPVEWVNNNISDGGHQGFDIADPSFRFSMWWGPQLFVSKQNGAYSSWLWVSDQIAAEAAPFYPQVINDPAVSKTLYHGGTNVWRSKTAGQGSLSDEAFEARCNVWTGNFAGPCGDFVTLGPGAPGSAVYGTTRAGGTVSALARSAGDTGTLWVGTQTGRVLVSKNADATAGAAVSFTRVDDDSALSPGRFVSSIFVDPANPNRAWVTYSGYSAATPATPGHVFEVVYNTATATASWTQIDGGAGGLPDTPVTDLAYDDVTGDLYASSDFGVARRAAGTSDWVEAASGMPNLVVSSITILPGERILYAATHGMGAMRLNLAK